MTRFILGLTLAAAVVGCTSFQPVGPLSKGGAPAPKGGKAKDPDRDLPPEPVTVPAVKPTPPVNWVDPGDVSDDPHAAAQQLMREFEADQKTIPTAPRTAEISRIKNGISTTTRLGGGE
jgi:hypothetical protein